MTSPSNKTRDGRWAFDRKIRGFLEGGVNVVEIDLVRGGFSARTFHPGNWPDVPCAVSVIRAGNTTFAEVYPCPLREPLSAVRVPLRADEPDAALDLQPLIDRCYTRGRYWMLPYQEPPQPPLTEDDMKWAKEVTANAGVLE